MLSKLDPYDLFGAFVPGVLLMAAVAVLFPEVTNPIAASDFPDAFIVIALTVCAYFLGQVVQAVSSLCIPAVHWSWGGRPSERAVSTGLGERYLPKDDADRIRGKLASGLQDSASDRSIFLRAMSLSRKDKESLTSRFNGAYAYHRAILFMTLIMLGLVSLSRLHGAAATYSKSLFWTLVAANTLLCVLFWLRCHQRAKYFCREVLYSAERQLEPASTKPEKENDE
jgi:hypothetical protein